MEKYILITHWFSLDLFHVTQWSQITMHVGRPTYRYALYHQAGKIEIKNTCNVLILSIIYVALYYELHYQYFLYNMCCFNLLGTGTFGRVILCRDRQKKSQVSALKVMRITELIRLKQVQHVMSEKSVLLSISHPFIVNL